MSLASCVAEALEAKKIDADTADELSNLDNIDEQEVIDAALSSAWLKMRQDTLQVTKTVAALEEARQHPRGLIDGVNALIVRDKYSQVGSQNIDNTSKAIRGEFDRHISEMLYAYRTKNLGFTQDKDGLEQLISGLYGKTTKNIEAGKYAGQVSKVIEYSRQRFNRAGGAISKLDNYIPNSHSATKIRGGRGKVDPEAAREAWVNYMLTEVKVKQFVDDGGRPVTDVRQKEIMRDIWETLATEGNNKIEPGIISGSGKLANKGQAQRILHFEDPESWLKYHKEYGDDDIFTTLTSYMDGMAADIAAMEVLGPNPNLTMKYLTDTAKKEGASGMDIKHTGDIYSVQTGQGTMEQDMRVAEAFQETRAMISAGLLSGAMLSSFGDTALLALTAAYNGLPAMKALGRAFKLMNPANEADRLLAAQAGLVADVVKNKSYSASERFLSETGKSGGGWGSRANETVMRASWLQGWTEAIRLGFAMEFTAYAGKQTAKNFDQVDGNFKRAIEHYRITADDWKILQGVKQTDIKGSKFLTAESIMEAGLPTEQAETLHKKYMGMILQESDYAALTPDARTRAIFGAGEKGTIRGELLISTAMFKSFPMTMWNTHVMRGVYGTSTKGGSMAYLGALTLGTAGIASFGLQAKELAKGRDMRDMTDPKFVSESFMLGGGLGIFADFMFQDHNRFGHQSGVTMGGPVWGAGQDLLGIGQTLLEAPFADQPLTEVAGAGTDALKFATNYLPLDVWQTRLLTERFLFDQIALAMNPDLEAQYSQQRQRRTQDYGNDQWWPKGETAPARAPQYTTMEE